MPADASILAAEIGGIGGEHPLSAEKLSPVLSLYFVENFAAALDACEAVLRSAAWVTLAEFMRRMTRGFANMRCACLRFA